MGIFNSLLDGGILGLAGDALGAVFGSHSASEANQTNIKNAREQRAWEETMSNNAVQRRANDIERAGGNRALAFTGGQSASTPSVSAPTVEPTFRPEWTKGTVAQSQLLTEQLRSMRINNLKTSQDAALTAQEARIRKIEADAAERYGPDKADWEYQKAELSVSEAKQRLKNMLLEGAQTAAQTERLQRTMESIVQLAQQQARAGKLDLDALERVASIGGVEAGKMSGVMRTAIDIYKTLFKGKD